MVLVGIRSTVSFPKVPTKGSHSAHLRIKVGPETAASGARHTTILPPESIQKRVADTWAAAGSRAWVELGHWSIVWNNLLVSFANSHAILRLD